MTADLCFDTPQGSALFSPCKIYRYSLTRTWGEGKPLVFIMLNPSTADATINDPTIARCERRAHGMGFPGLEVVNLFALRSTDPRALYEHSDPVGPENDAHLWRSACGAAMVICAWGEHGTMAGRGRDVVAMLLSRFVRLHYLKLTKSGEPGHPLYVPYQSMPQRWEGYR